MTRTREEALSHRSRRLKAALVSVNLRRERGRRRWSRPQIAALYDHGNPLDPFTPSVLKYWEKMAANPARLRALGRHGGRRWSKMSGAVATLVRHKLFRHLQRFKVVDMHILCPVLSKYATAVNRVLTQDPLAAPIAISSSYVYRIFRDWNWSFKVPTTVHLHKFRTDNVILYLHYVIAVTWIPPARLKFLDEASFVHRGMARPLAPTLLSIPHVFIYCF